jgi:hypothetical protein
MVFIFSRRSNPIEAIADRPDIPVLLKCRSVDQDQARSCVPSQGKASTSPFCRPGFDGGFMSDLIMVATGLGFFALAILYTLVCEKL